MAVCDIQIQGRNFQLACDDGQESRVRALAHEVDLRMVDLKQRMGGGAADGTLLLLTTLTLCNEVHELKQSLKQEKSVDPAFNPTQNDLILENAIDMEEFSNRLEILIRTIEEIEEKAL